MEVMVGIALTLLLALGVGPLVLSMQTSGIREGDRSVSVLQGRVAAARLERDLRTATAEHCPFQTSGPILQATAQQIVFLSSLSDGNTLKIIEWEVVGSSLMRRWGTCPTQRPGLASHKIYLDNKTMLEGLGARSTFSYVLYGGVTMTEVDQRDLCRIKVVGLSCDGVDRDGAWSTLVGVKARVGR